MRSACRAFFLLAGGEGDLVRAGGGRDHALAAARSDAGGLVVEGHFQRGEAEVRHADHGRRFRQQGGIGSRQPGDPALLSRTAGISAAGTGRALASLKRT